MVIFCQKTCVAFWLETSLLDKMGSSFCLMQQVVTQPEKVLIYWVLLLLASIHDHTSDNDVEFYKNIPPNMSYKLSAGDFQTLERTILLSYLKKNPWIGDNLVSSARDGKSSLFYSRKAFLRYSNAVFDGVELSTFLHQDRPHGVFLMVVNLCHLSNPCTTGCQESEATWWTNQEEGRWVSFCGKLITSLRAYNFVGSFVNLSYKIL